MSLFNKSKHEIVQYFDKNFSINEKTGNIIINECIDGEVLFEMTDEDFNYLNLNSLDTQNIRNEIEEEKKTLKEQKEDELIYKLISLGIKDPIEYIFSNQYKVNLKIGVKILLQKLRNKLSHIINEKTNKKEIFDFLENKLKISKESRNLLEGLKINYIFKLLENGLNDFDININDKNKLKNYINYIKINHENIVKAIWLRKDKIEIDNDIETKMKLEEMIIYKSDDNKKVITMEDFYKKLEGAKDILFNYKTKKTFSEQDPYHLILDEGIIAKIINKPYSSSFDFSIGNIYLKNIFKTPIRTKIKTKKELLDFHMISQNQINYCLKKFGILIPFFKCNKCQRREQLDIFYYIDHKNCNDILIYDISDRLEFENEEEFKNYFPQKNKKVFSSRVEFERNFNKYYNKYNHIKIDNPFIYYDDIVGRNIMLSYLGNYEYFGKYLIFYGIPDIGKSILVNYALKYKIDHNKIKTLYINCKYLYKLTKYHNDIVTQDIFLSEIPFLFYNDYQSHIKCADSIKNFELKHKKTYQDLINIILNYLSTKNSNKYLIVFDQYNNKTDPEGKIKDIINEIL